MRRTLRFRTGFGRSFYAVLCPTHAFLKSILQRQRKLPGVRAVITSADIPPVLTGLRMKDMPLLARDRVRYVGEPVAAATADSSESAEAALNLIDSEYEALPSGTERGEAIRPGAPSLP